MREAELDFMEQEFNKNKMMLHPVETVKKLKSPKVQKETTDEPEKGMFFD